MAYTLIGFYVTMIRETTAAPKVAWLLGPFDSKEIAEARVADARAEAEKIDRRCVWDAFGVTRVERTSGGPLPSGVLNERLAA